VPPVQPPNIIIKDAHGGGSALAFDDSSSLLASGGWVGVLNLWSVPEGKLITQWQAHTDSVIAIHFLHNRQQLLTASFDGSFAIWSMEGELVRRISAEQAITSMAFDENSGLIITGHVDGSIRIWQYPGFERLQNHAVHKGIVKAVALHGQRKQFASGGDDRRVYTWHMGDDPVELSQPSSDTLALSFNNTGDLLIGSGWEYLYQWQLPSGHYRKHQTEHGGYINDLQYSQDNHRIVSISRQTDSAVKVLDASNGKTIKSLQPHNLCGASVRYSPNERYIASSSDDASIYIWDMQRPLPLTDSYKTGE
jgi:WD40 repeat protein